MRRRAAIAALVAVAGGAASAFHVFHPGETAAAFAQASGAETNRPSLGVGSVEGATTVRPGGVRLVQPERYDRPVAGRRLAAREVLEIAEAVPAVRDVRHENPHAYARAYMTGALGWQVSLFTPPPRGELRREEIAQVLIDDRTGRVQEAWTGVQVAWPMARGYPGAFGRAVNSPWVWIGLCVLFVLPFARPPLRMLHLDLAILLAFSVPYALFGAAELGLSIPAAYPLLAYLLVRMLFMAARRRSPPADASEPVAAPGRGAAPARARESESEAGPGSPAARAPGLDRAAGRASPTARAPGLDKAAEGRPSPTLAAEPESAARRHTRTVRAPELRVGPAFLLLAIFFLAGFRIALNVTDGNVIDVGYGSVIGADRLAAGAPLYGSFPADNPRGDTYGPVLYAAYVPFEAALPWSGTWDDLPAAHAAALAFDLGCAVLLWLLGRRLQGLRLGLLLAYLWMTYPFTLLVANSGANDALVPLLVLAALLFAARPIARGALVALAGLTKFAPLALAPLFATYRARGSRTMIASALAFVAVTALVLAPFDLDTFWERTLGFQRDRDSPFSIWGYYDLPDPLQVAAQAAAAALAVAVAFVPRARDIPTLAALAAAVLLALQLTVDHWFYLYLVWFAPLVWIALLSPLPDAGSARSRPLAAAAGSG